MLNTKYFLYAMLAMSHSVFAEPLAGAKSQKQKVNSAQLAIIYGCDALIRSRNSNIEIQNTCDAQTFKDYADLRAMIADKRARVLKSSASGIQRDKVDIQTRAVPSFDMADEKNGGAGSKDIPDKNLLQGTGRLVSFYASFSGQLAARKLDVSGRLEQGSGYAVRPYPEGEAHTDQGYVLSLEARIKLPALFEAQKIASQLIGFVDTGTMTVNKNSWVDGLNRRELNGAGLGLNFLYVDNFEIKAYYADGLGNDTGAQRAPGLFWILGLKYF